MSGRVPGVIALSYARSAGTGDQAVPGMVTSRRDSTNKERFKLKQQRQEEEEKAKRRQEEMQAAARLLAQKWAAEDSKKKSKKRSRSRSRRRRRGDDDPREAAARLLAQKWAEDGDREEGRGEGGAREASDEEHEGGWVQMPRKEDPKLEPARSSPSRTFREQGPPVSAAPSRGGGWASIDEPEREASRPITGSAAGLAGGAPLAQRAAAGPAGSAARKERLARVFAFGDEEDDDESRRREVELAEKSKKSKLSVEAQARPSSSAAMSGIRTPLPDAGGGGAVDMCSQLMKMAEWKRKCGGKRVPMPEDMKASVARAMGANPL